MELRAASSSLFSISLVLANWAIWAVVFLVFSPEFARMVFIDWLEVIKMAFSELLVSLTAVVRSLSSYLLAMVCRAVSLAASDTGEGPLFDEVKVVSPINNSAKRQTIPATIIIIFDFLSKPLA